MRCNIEKQVRIRIASNYKDILNYGGLTIREWSSKKRYDALPDEVKNAMAERGKIQLEKIRNKQLLYI